QTLSRPSRLQRLRPDFATVVVDEAHHATAESYRRVLAHVEVSQPLVLGVTATAERADGAALGEVFDKVVYEAKLFDMIRRGYLAELRAIQVKLAADFDALHTRAGDFIESESEALLLAADAPHVVARAYRQHAMGRKALVFTPTVRTAHAMAKAFVEIGMTAEAVDGETPLEMRRELLGRFHRGETRVVANCGVLTEGYDEPTVDCIVTARPTQSRPLFVQMIGRGTRRYPGKSNCLVLDVVGLTSHHDLQTVARLFGVPPAGEIENSVLGAVATRRRKEVEHAARGALVSRAVDLFRARPLNWISVSPERFALAIGEHGTLVLDALADARWAVRQLTRDRGEVTLESGLDLAYANGWAEDHARRLGARALIDREAAWGRTQASPKPPDALPPCP